MSERKHLKHLKDLTPDPQNARSHNARNIGQIAHSLQSFGANRGIVIDEDGVILAGNGVWEAAAEAGIESVRVVETDGEEIVAIQVRHLTEEQKTQYAIADNRTGELSEWNTEQLAALVEAGTDLGDWWFDGELDDLLGVEDEYDTGGGGESENPYSQKVDTPIYDPSGEVPLLSDLLDTGKRDELVERIWAVPDIPDDVRSFLMTAAERHVVFDYRNIAEYYTHAAPEVQRLMEASALVIIDMGAAIEEGYVRARNRFLTMIEGHRE